MKYNKMVIENVGNRNTFLITCVFSVLLLITLCFFGVKGTQSAESYVCSNSSWVIVDGTSSCCPAGWNYDDGYCVDGTFYNKLITDDYCLNNDYLVSDGSVNYCSKSGWEIYNGYNCVNYDVDSCRVTAGSLVEASQTVSYKVIYNAMGGTVSPSSDTCVVSATGGSVGCSIGSLAIPERKGFVFGGWTKTTANCSSGPYFTNDTEIFADTTIYACWNHEEASCHYKVLPDNLIDGFSYTATLTTFSSPQKFNNESYDCRTTLLLDKDASFYDNEVAVQNYLGQICDYASESSTLGSILARGWYCYLKKTTSLTAGDGTMRVDYTLTYDGNGGIIKSTDLNKTGTTWDAIYRPGQSISLITGEYQQLGIYVSRTGYTFKGWAETKTACNSGNYLGTDFTITSDKTIYACWESNSTSETKACYMQKSNNLYYYGDYSNMTDAYVFDSNVSESDCEEKNRRYATFYSQGTQYDKKSCLLTYISGGSIQCSVSKPSTNPTRSGYEFTGWGVNANCDATTSTFTVGTGGASWYACWKATSTGENPGGTTPKPEEPDEPDTPVIEYKKRYNVEYDLDGGKFANGETSRTVIVSDTEKLEKPLINPIKDGYKFIGWYNGNSKFNGFGDYITRDYELVAHYEKIEDNKCSYTCNGNDMYDPSINKCISIDANGKSTGVITNRIQIELACANSVAQIGEIISRNDDYTCPSGYIKDYWLAYDTCRLGGECINTGKTCERRFEAICYKTYNATEKCSTDTGNGGNVNNDENITENPKTGEIAIAITWFLGLMAIGYAFYYFRSVKQN